MNSTPEKQGDKSLFMNSDRYCSSNNAPTESFSLLFTFGWKRNSPASKSISPSVIPAVPWRIQGFLQSIKGTSSSFFSRSNWVETQESTSEIVSIYKSCNLTFSSHIAKWQPEFVTRWPQSAFYFHVSRWPQSALSFFLYFRIVCNLYIYIYTVTKIPSYIYIVINPNISYSSFHFSIQLTPPPFFSSAHTSASHFFNSQSHSLLISPPAQLRYLSPPP